MSSGSTIRAPQVTIVWVMHALPFRKSLLSTTYMVLCPTISINIGCIVLNIVEFRDFWRHTPNCGTMLYKKNCGFRTRFHFGGRRNFHLAAPLWVSIERRWINTQMIGACKMWHCQFHLQCIVPGRIPAVMRMISHHKTFCINGFMCRETWQVDSPHILPVMRLHVTWWLNPIRVPSEVLTLCTEKPILFTEIGYG